MASSSQVETGNPFEFRGDVRYIFLSHSGVQKGFVENLYYALEKANQKPFLDIISLPKASRFPDDIKRAVQHCKLGIVVLSNDFMMSKWPMLELEMLFQEGKPILPLFYQLQTEDLKSKDNLSKWRKRWKMMLKVPADRVEKREMVPADQVKKWEGLVKKHRAIIGIVFKRKQREMVLNQVKKWEGLVKKLCAINGIVYKQQQSENSYIGQVVAEICKLVPPQLVYDLSLIQGYKDLAKEVEKLFDERKCEGPRIVGLHGEGGLGKTTLCMSMVNFYNFLYDGRSYLMEFPTNGDESTILRECKKILEKLGIHSDHVLKGIDRFDQVIQVIKDLVGRHDIFLAIDNVWPSTQQAVGRLVSVGFSADSKILLTSRSEQVLWHLLDDPTNKNKNNYVGRLPAPKREDALKILEQSLVGFTSLVGNQMDNLLKKCRFDGNYHPLALQALGEYVRRSLDVSGPERPRVLEDINKIRLDKVEDSIRFNYELLREDMKCLFLDIALLIETKISETFIYFYSEQDIENALFRCVCFLHENLLKSEVDQMVYSLADAGVIQREANKVGRKKIKMHDLYLELARNEAKRSPRFLIDWPQSGRPKTFEEGEDNHRFIEKLQQQSPELKFCYCGNTETSNRIQMMSMPSLCILLIKPGYFSYNWKESVGAPSQIDLSGCRKLAFVSLAFSPFERIHGLSALWNLQMLFIRACPHLNNLDGLSSLTKLEILVVECCDKLKKLPDLGGSTGLEMLRLIANGSLEEVGFVGAAALKELCISRCDGLKKCVGFTGVERLLLRRNKSLEEVGCVGAALKEVAIEECRELKLPDLGASTNLETLMLWGNNSMEEVGRLGPSLKELAIEDFHALKKLQDVASLERLTLKENHFLREVGCVGAALKKLTIKYCYALKKLPDLGASTGLETLTLGYNHSMEEVGRLGPSLKELHIVSFKALKKLPDVASLTGLERLTLESNGSLEDRYIPPPASRPDNWRVSWLDDDVW